MRCNRIIKSSLQWTSLPYFLLLCSLQKRKKKEKRNIRILFFFSLAQKEKNHSSLLNCNKDTFISSPFFHIDRAHRTMEGRERRTMSDKEETNFSTGTSTTGWPHARIGNRIRQLSEYYKRGDSIAVHPVNPVNEPCTAY